MKKLIILLVIIFTLVSLVPMVAAQEPATDTATDNACNPGGSMNGKCTTNWHWNCGWYVARYESGEYKLEQVPFDCAMALLIPYLPPTEIPVALLEQFCTLITMNGGTFTFAGTPGSQIQSGSYAVSATGTLWGGGVATDYFADGNDGAPVLTGQDVIWRQQSPGAYIGDYISGGTCAGIIGNAAP